MEIKNARLTEKDWGYYYDDQIFWHFKERPDTKISRYFYAYPLINPSLEITEGIIEFRLIEIEDNEHSGSSLRRYFADPIFKLYRIR